LEIKDVLMWLRTANKQDVSQVLEVARAQQELLSRIDFKIGDEVWFDAGKRGIVNGTITKTSTKLFKVLTPTGLQWSVAPNLLNKKS